MTHLLQTLRPDRWLPRTTLRPNRFGWIGVDVGRHSVKLVQVERRGLDWRPAAYWTLEDAEIDADAEPSRWIDAHRKELRTARSLMRGRVAAVCLSSTVLRTLQVPEGPPEERLEMVRQELATDDETGELSLEVDVWPATLPSATGQGDVVSVALASREADGVGNGLWRAGYHARVLDVAPYAMARAIRLCDPFGDEPCIGLKIDADSSLLVFLHDGKPGFCRVLRGCGLRSIAEPLAAKLGVTAKAAERILSLHGIPGEGGAARPSNEAFFRLFSTPLQKLADEVVRTCAFLHPQRPEQAASRIWLFGDGGTVRNLPAYLTGKCGIPTIGWSPEFPAVGHPEDAGYGIAAGLSALAWEM